MVFGRAHLTTSMGRDLRDYLRCGDNRADRVRYEPFTMTHQIICYFLLLTLVAYGVFATLSVIAAYRWKRDQYPIDQAFEPAVTIFKPVCGIDAGAPGHHCRSSCTSNSTRITPRSRSPNSASASCPSRFNRKAASVSTGSHVSSGEFNCASCSRAQT